MGFFFREDTAPKPARAAKAPATPDPEAVGCDCCPIAPRKVRLASAMMPMFRERDADILVLGESPEKTEDMQGRPFVGKSGQLLRGLVPPRFRNRLAYQNAVRCFPGDAGGNRTPVPQEVHACSPYLADDIRQLRPKAILGVGGVPLRRFVADTDATVTKIHGTWLPLETAGLVTWYFPVLHPAFVLRDHNGRGPSYAVFRSDLEKFFREADRLPDPEITALEPSAVRCVHSGAEAMALLADMKDPIAFDIETTGLKPFPADARILTAAFSDGTTTFAIPAEHPEAPNDWGWRVIDHVVSHRRWIGHNAQFELLWCWYRKGGPEAWNPGWFGDTMALGRIFHERSSLLSLNVLSRIHLGTAVKEAVPVDRRRIAEYPLAEILPYNGLDALATILLYRRLADRADRWQVGKLLGTVKSVTAAELLGLPVDTAAAASLFAKFDAVRQGAVARAMALYEVRQFEAEVGEFSIASPEKVGIALTKYGKLELPLTAKSLEDPDARQRYSTRDEVLEQLAGRHPLVDAVREYRDSEKCLGTYIEPVLDGRLVAPDNKIHPSYNAFFVHTLRLSSDGPNIQNFPKHGHREVRSMVVAEKGKILVAIDYGQIQGRIMAMASADRRLIQAFIHGLDIHSEWRDRLLAIHPGYMDHVRSISGETDGAGLLKAARNAIKSDFVFASLFGATAASCAERTGVPLAKMQQLQSDLWFEYPSVQRWHRAKQREYADTGTITMLSGRKRHGLMMGMEPINNSIQAGEADIVLSAQNELAELALRERDMHLMPRINVHDDLTMILPDSADAIEHYLNRIMPIMVRPRFDWITVPLTVEVSVGYNWADMVEIIPKYSGDYHR